MSGDRTIWGVHMPDDLGSSAVKNGFIAIGWDQLGDLSRIERSRDAYKDAFRRAVPDAKEGALPVWAGVLYRFVAEMAVGDLVIYPAKADRLVHIGEIVGDYQHTPGESTYNNRRAVRWVCAVPREVFSQPALYEIGSAVTLFQVSTHADEFVAAFEGRALDSEDVDADGVDAVSAQVEESTEDFVLKRLKTAQDAYQFEHFVAHLLTCMGYHARVTKASGDGGIDVIAHRDELGFEPPIIKVQCKQSLDKIGRPVVQQLHGAIETGEHGLFVTLGSFSPDARTFERSKPNLRLIDGEALVDLIYSHYDKFDQRWRGVIPLKRTYIPGSVKAADS